MILQSVAKVVVFTVTSAFNAQADQSVTEPPALTMMMSSELVCDDGQRPFTSNDRPVWKCEIEGCNFAQTSCYYEENMCFDEFGDSLLAPDEECPHTVTVAKGALSSFKNFLFCDGSYHCKETNSIGLCIDSICVENMLVDFDLDF